MHFMLQKEVVDRMGAGNGSKDYGRLSVIVKYHCQVDVCFDVPPDAFDPPPKVQSSIVRLIPYQKLPFIAKDYLHFYNVVKQAFSQRRKKIRNSLKEMVREEDWKILNIDAMLRPEQLTVEDFVRLSNQTI
jgi:16S rRNA (adenine1518-N6/adenine1519-N6)-dimethyltransferase